MSKRLEFNAHVWRCEHECAEDQHIFGQSLFTYLFFCCFVFVRFSHLVVALCVLSGRLHYATCAHHLIFEWPLSGEDWAAWFIGQFYGYAERDHIIFSCECHIHIFYHIVYSRYRCKKFKCTAVCMMFGVWCPTCKASSGKQSKQQQK